MEGVQRLVQLPIGPSGSPAAQAQVIAMTHLMKYGGLTGLLQRGADKALEHAKRGRLVEEPYGLGTR